MAVGDRSRKGTSRRGVRWGIDGQGRIAPHQPTHTAVKGAAHGASEVEKETEPR